MVSRSESLALTRANAVAWKVSTDSVAWSRIFLIPRIQWPSSPRECFRLRNTRSMLIRCRYSRFHADENLGNGPSTRRFVPGCSHISLSQWVMALVPPVLSGQPPA